MINKSTALFMVFFTTYIFGALLKPIANFCLIKTESGGGRKSFKKIQK
jgi:hypothetical protein